MVQVINHITLIQLIKSFLADLRQNGRGKNCEDISYHKLITQNLFYNRELNTRLTDFQQPFQPTRSPRSISNCVKSKWLNFHHYC